MSARDGGPAFPAVGVHGESDTSGMSVRDYFAGRSLQGLRTRISQADLTPKSAADAAYRDADAMLAERAK